jgi:flagellar biosynthesis regulator FlaF
MAVLDKEWQDGDDTIMVEEAIEETLRRIIAVLVEARDADEKLQKEIHANAYGRFMTQDEDADQSYLEGKVTAYNHAIQLLVEG